MQGSEEAPKAPLGNNARPVQPLHQRTIRTNINFRNSEVSISSSFLIQRILLTFIAPGKLSRGKQLILQKYATAFYTYETVSAERPFIHVKILE